MTDQDHAKIVPNGEPFTDEDGYAVADEILEYFEHYQIATLAPIASIIRRERHNARLAAEAAAFEKAAAYIEGKGEVIPGSTVFIPLITGSNQPCMSGDGRDHLNPHKRRQFDDATSTLATAIRKLAGEKHD